MSRRDDDRLDEARAIPIKEIADRLKIERLTPRGDELVAPCPVCGGKEDKLQINTLNNVFLCRAFGGGDGIGLVEHVLGCDFKEALTWLVGEGVVQLSDEEKAKRKAARDAEDRKRSKIAARKRAESIAMARAVWADGRPFAGSPAEDYLALRGIVLDAPPRALRYHPALRYMHKIDSQWTELHRGPAMLAGILAPNGDLIGVHRTWIDLSRPKGKAEIRHGETVLNAKKVLGSQKGGAIRLDPLPEASVLIMGEGIETTFTALIAKPFQSAHYWAGVSLDNMAGKMRKVKGKRHSGLPKMADENAFVPPHWVRRLVFLMDGDSEPKMTRAKLESGLRRAMALQPDLRGQIVHAGDGIDLNDLLLGAT
ncbi:hypothetical protein AADZ90_021295 [Aestuariibius sp. 2305UL40-4]|uniref:DUF7146 domain-containing protein n=1 Tax=Aestuariibius violaceus TaxID=3234132 RepID=UPI00345E934B